MKRSRNVRRLSRSRKSNRKVVRKSKRRVVEKSKRRTNHKKRRINSKRRKKRTLKIKGGNPLFTRRRQAIAELRKPLMSEQTELSPDAGYDASSSWTPEPKFIHIKQKRKIQKSLDQMKGKVKAGTKCLMLARGKPESDSKGKILILVRAEQLVKTYDSDFGLVIINGTEDKSYMDDCEDFPFELLDHNSEEMGRRIRSATRSPENILRIQKAASEKGEGVVHKYKKSRLDKMYQNLEELNPGDEKYSEIGNISEIKEKALEYIRDVLNPTKNIFDHFDDNGNGVRWPFAQEHKVAIQKEIAATSLSLERKQRVLSWCTKGSIAKYDGKLAEQLVEAGVGPRPTKRFDGKLGEVQGKPNMHFQVKLRWANGVESGWITALHLTQATDSEAEEFKQQQQQVAEQVLTLQREEEIEVNSEPTGNPSIRASNAASDAIRLQQREEEEVKSLPEKYSKLTKLNCVVGLPITSMFEEKNGVIEEYAGGETARVMFDDDTTEEKYLSELFVNEQELENGLNRRLRDRWPLTKEATDAEPADAAGLGDMSVDV